MNIIGFKIIGAPNKIGSLIPNKAGKRDTFPICWYLLFFDSIQATIHPILIPHPVNPKNALEVPAV